VADQIESSADTGDTISSRLLDLWACASKLVMELSKPDQPTDNAPTQSFNGMLRDDCLNVHRFDDLTYAKNNMIQ
jgi:putative transposase